MLHGLKVNELLTGARPLPEIATAVIGIVATGTDADAQAFPLNDPVLVTNIRAMLGKAGTQGTLAKALQAIVDQANAVVVVVRVAEGTGGSAEAQTTANTIGAATGGNYTGLQALLAAEAQLGVRPRIIGCPGLDNSDVTTAMIPIFQTLRGFGYAKAIGATPAAAVTYANTFEARELMLIWPEDTNWAGDAVARALGLRAKIDEEIGWHKTLSNVPVNGIKGLAKDVYFDLSSSATDAGILNTGGVTTIVNIGGGYRFWGNRGRSTEPKYAFESTVRTAQAIKDACAKGLAWMVDQPLTANLIRDGIESINADLRRMTAQGRLIGGKAWFDPALNSQVDLAAGKLAIDFDYTPASPAEGITINQRLTDRYYGTLAASVGAG